MVDFFHVCYYQDDDHLETYRFGSKKIKGKTMQNHQNTSSLTALAVAVAFECALRMTHQESFEQKALSLTSESEQSLALGNIVEIEVKYSLESAIETALSIPFSPLKYSNTRVV